MGIRSYCSNETENDSRLRRRWFLDALRLYDGV